MRSKGGSHRTVKEVSQLTGISIRTLRYYDDKALEKLQEIMFFKEMDLIVEQKSGKEINVKRKYSRRESYEKE